MMDFYQNQRPGGTPDGVMGSSVWSSLVRKI